MYIIEINEVRDECLVYKKGIKIVIDRVKVVLKQTNAIFIHALVYIHLYITKLRGGVSPKKLGLSKDWEYVYNQCVDPMGLYTTKENQPCQV